MGCRRLSFSYRADIAVGILAGKTNRQIGVDFGRDHTIIWRESRRNSTKTRGYRPVSTDCAAERRRKRPQQARRIDTDVVLAARVKSDPARSRTPRRIAGRLHLEATDAGLGHPSEQQAALWGNTFNACPLA